MDNGGEADRTTIQMGGDLAQLVSQVNSLSVGLAFAAGELMDGEQVLMPLLSCELEGTFRETGSDTRALTLTFDNLAFVLLQLAKEFARHGPTIGVVANSGIPPAHARVRYAVEWLDQASNALSESSALLRLLLVESEPAKAATETASKSLPRLRRPRHSSRK